MKLLSWLFRNLKEDKKGFLSTTAVFDKCNNDFINEPVSQAKLTALVQEVFNVEVKYLSSTSGEKVSRTKYFMGLNWETSFENISFERLSCQIILFHEYGFMVEKVTNEELRASFDTGVQVNRQNVPITAVFKANGEWTLLRSVQNVELDNLLVNNTTMGFDLVYIRKLLKWIRSLRLCQGKHIGKLSFHMKGLKVETIITELDSNTCKMTARSEFCELLVGSGNDPSNLACSQCVKYVPEESHSNTIQAVITEGKFHIDDDVMTPLMYSEHTAEPSSGRTGANRVLDNSSPMLAVKSESDQGIILDECAMPIEENMDTIGRVEEMAVRMPNSKHQSTQSVTKLLAWVSADADSSNNPDPLPDYQVYSPSLVEEEPSEGIIVTGHAINTDADTDDNFETTIRIAPNFWAPPLDEKRRSIPTKKKKSAMDDDDDNDDDSGKVSHKRYVKRPVPRDDPEYVPERKIGPGKIECEMCGKSYKHLFRHRQQCVGKKPKVHKCSQCGKCFDLWTKLAVHRVEVHCIESSAEKNESPNDLSHENIAALQLQELEDIIDEQTETSKASHRKNACRKCGKKFTHTTSLNQHVPHCRLIPCRLCGERFYGKLGVRNHGQLVHPDQPRSSYVSSIAGYDAEENDGKSLEKDDSPCVCDKCGKKLTTSKSLKLHVVQCRPIPCRLCGEKFYGKIGLLAHRKLAHPKNHMFKTLGSDRSALDHTRSEITLPSGPRKRNPHVCHKCGKSFMVSASLNMHVLRCKLFPCSICGVKVYGKLGLAKHRKLMHPARGKLLTGQLIVCEFAEIKPDEEYVCEICGEVCGNRPHLVNHKRSHKEKKSATCQTCGKTVRENYLEAHMRIHTGECPYICEFCGKGFKIPSKLYDHRFVHTDEVLCKTCGKRFSSRRRRLQHEAIHTGVKGYQCQVCTHQFYTKARLMHHYRVKHGDEKVRPLDARLRIGSRTESTNTDGGSIVLWDGVR